MASNSIEVYVKIPTGRNAQYIVATSDTIETICGKIAAEEKVKATQVRLKYQGKILNRSHTMSQLGVRPETILKAEILVPRDVRLMVALPDGLGETEVITTSLDTVTSVVNNIADIIKQPSSRIVLKYEGRVVKGHTLMDAGLADGSVLEVQIAEEAESAKVKKTGGASIEKEDQKLDDDKRQDIVNSFDAGGRRVEVVFSFDTTGSMYSCLDEVRNKLRECCTRLIQDIPNIRIGVIAHGDYCDQDNSYVLRSVDLTSDVQALVDFVRSVPKTGGGDCPECYEWVLRKAQGLDWSEDSAKALVVIGDAAPHPPSYTDQQIFWKDELSVLTGMGVKVYGVHALTQTGSRPFYEELAEASGGHYLKLAHFDVITDMFLAVCYREAHEEDLEAFAREVEEAGRMDDNRRDMFRRLENPNPAPANNRQQREIEADWWDPSRDHGSPQYRYDAAKDKWVGFSSGSLQVPKTESEGTPTPTVYRGPATSSARSRSKRHHGSKRCSIM